MRLLSGRALDMQATGSVYVNNDVVDAGVMRDNTSYLAGSQLLIPELTVKESLHFVLNFIEKYDTSPELREVAIHEVMDDLDILHLATQRIGRAGSKKGLNP